MENRLKQRSHTCSHAINIAMQCQKTRVRPSDAPTHTAYW